SVELASAFRNGSGDNPVILAGDIIHIPEATVRNAYIVGNIRSSQTINLREPTTLTQAIAMAGGITSGAQLDKVLIRRQVAGTLNRQEILVNVNEINKRQRDDVAIQPNDIIEIPGPKGVKKVLDSILRTLVPTLTQLPVRVIP
ncbi:MAG TPA: SLBB domain-containing protein, partial [Pyrinomonadaceae bacterium]|nr:SLBB domain-containing protein [Pyrinomonadaceae bacterium]